MYQEIIIIREKIVSATVFETDFHSILISGKHISRIILSPGYISGI